MRQGHVRPVTLAVAPGIATTPGHLGQLALWLGGLPVRAYPGEAVSQPPPDPMPPSGREVARREPGRREIEAETQGL